MNADQQTEQSPFGPVIYSYTRAQALEDGEQVEIPASLSQEAGIKFPVYLTRGAYAATVEAGGHYEPDQDDEVLVLPGCQDFKGRLWDVLTLLRLAARQGGQIVRFSVLVDINGDGKRRRVNLRSECGPVDIDDPAPAITVMLPEES